MTGIMYYMFAIIYVFQKMLIFTGSLTQQTELIEIWNYCTNNNEEAFEPKKKEWIQNLMDLRKFRSTEVSIFFS